MNGPSGHDSLIPPPDRAIASSSHSKRLRHLATAVLALLVLAGLSGYLGVRSTTTSTRTAELELAVEHALVTRGGLATPFEVTVRRPGGFEGPVELRVSSDYLDRFDENGFDPAPDSARADGAFTTWTWDSVEGDTHVVSIDARLEPGVHWRVGGVVEARTGGAVARVRIDTWVAP